MLNINKFLTTEQIFVLKMSLERAYQDVRHCIWEKTQSMTPMVLKKIFQNSKKMHDFKWNLVFVKHLIESHNFTLRGIYYG